MGKVLKREERVLVQRQCPQPQPQRPVNYVPILVKGANPRKEKSIAQGEGLAHGKRAIIPICKA